MGGGEKAAIGGTILGGGGGGSRRRANTIRYQMLASQGTLRNRARGKKMKVRQEIRLCGEKTRTE